MGRLRREWSPEAELQETYKDEQEAREVGAMANQHCQQQGTLNCRCRDSH